MTGRRALVCAPLPPEFDRESGSRRIFHLIEFLQEAGWAVTLLVQNEADGARHMRLLRQRGVAAYSSGDQQIEAVASMGGFDLAIVAFWHLAASYAPRIRALSPGTRIIVDSIDVHFLRQARGIVRASDGAPSLDETYGRETVAALNTYAGADAVLTVSQKESDLLNDLLAADAAALAHAVPDCEQAERCRRPFAKRRGVLFLGNFRHPPNVDALEYLADAIAPRIASCVLRDHPIAVVGNGVTDAVTRAVRRIPHATLVGWVPSVVPYFERARVTIAPLRYGAGTKRKLIQSLMLGTPCVTTRIGAEGFNLDARRHVLVADTPDAFAQAVETALHGAGLWRRLAAEGHAAISRTHGRAAVKARFLDVVEQLLHQERKPDAASETPVTEPGGRTTYRHLVTRVRDIVAETIPAGATVAVLSKGDPDLVQLGDRRAWHFPQNGRRGYAGHYPADSAGAIGQLQRLRSEGAPFLVIPETSRWWLTHYAGFRKHLDAHARVAWSSAECLIYALAAHPAGVRKGVLNS